ncbi:MAG TPA: hypothetical protein VGX76_15345, partial [Pirellulales bacterium]|nr:hypothetical protein [Pirellulales bacterium]
HEAAPSRPKSKPSPNDETTKPKTGAKSKVKKPPQSGRRADPFASPQAQRYADRPGSGVERAGEPRYFDDRAASMELLDAAGAKRAPLDIDNPANRKATAKKQTARKRVPAPALDRRAIEDNEVASSAAAGDRYGPTLEAAQPEPLAAETRTSGRRASRKSKAFDEPTPHLAAPEGEEGTGKPGSRHLEGAQNPTLSLEKTAPQEIQVGKSATFTIRVRNTGKVAAQGVEIRDEIPQGTQLTGTRPQASRARQGQVVWSLGTFKPGDEAKVELELLPLTEGEIGSVATVHFAGEASVRTRCTRPQLAIEVQAPQEVLLGDKVTLSIRISNPGTGVASGVVLAETIPDQLLHPAGPDLEYEIGDLAPNESREVELTMTAAKAGEVMNLLRAKGEGQLQAEAQAAFDVVAPQLKVALQGPKRRYLERQATYTVSISNPGTATAREVELVTHLPKGLKFVDANNSGEYDPQTNSVRWMLEELPANETGEVKLTTMPVEAGEQTMRVEGLGKRGLKDEQEEVISIEGVAAILFQVVDVADPVEVGGETTYEIRVVNQGSKTATNVQLLVSLPQELKPTGAEGPARHEIAGQDVQFQPLAKLAPKAETTYRIHVDCLSPGDLRVQVQLLTDEMDKPVTKEESTRVYADE